MDIIDLRFSGKTPDTFQLKFPGRFTSAP